MQEYIQDGLTFVREYGRPCLFITFTCNPKWPEIASLLLPGQNAIHRHDITARVFRQKLKSLISFITKLHVFGPTRCWLYSVEWQKRGLPHAHILVWLIDKIRPEEIDSIISAEIPDPSTDQLLFDIVTTNMIHGPCGTLNSSSPCMANGKCTKNFPKDFTNDTVTNVDGYPIYRRRNPDNGGQSFIKNIINTDIDIDNRWVVPYSPLLSKTYNAHINVEFCSSVKSIKYICKYVHKGSDMAVFRVENTNVNAPPVNKNNEITLYQIGRYISSNEAAWRIFGFPIHERDPAAVHLENGQRVFFTNKTAIDRAINPPKTTLIAFFELCNRADDFVSLHEHYSIHKYHAISHGLKQKHGCPASKAHQLLHVSIYLNQTPWGDYLQSIQDTLSAPCNAISHSKINEKRDRSQHFKWQVQR
ncbi:uncharacterized protein LOC126264710 isoform X1 [Aethina tumida]|uniref:uncharacterized protein LOC126264710 isoform X1 n=1 Tax=Aethina tumida TaxID=116153 RepID=UPI002147A368|nr:uncharacterized protein LOC126264710 isoform X1 [Aethina tumida]